MTAATAPGAARAGHARGPRDERSSRTTMTKSVSRSQVRLIASTNAIFGADEAFAMLRISRDAMYRLANMPQTCWNYHKAIKPQHKGSALLVAPLCSLIGESEKQSTAKRRSYRWLYRRKRPIFDSKGRHHW